MELQGELLYPTMAVENKKGVVFYRHKNKHKEDYFLFELDESLIDDDALKRKWTEAWGIILRAAASVGIGFFDIEEVTIGVERAMKSLDIAGDKSADVTIPLMDHATKEMTTLTVGVSAAAADGCD